VAAKFEERLDRMVEVAREAERPYKALEGKPFNLSSSVARTLVVGSGLSKSAPEIVEREKARIAKWLEQGAIGPAKARVAMPKAAKPTAEKPDAVIAIPEEVAEAVAEHQERATGRKPTRKRAPRKTGEASETAKAIAVNRNPVSAESA
jgi:tRNA A37 N6-isopentenylltransferase MiaA